MKYKVSYSKEAIYDLKKIDYTASQRILKKINFWINQKNPLAFAKPLKGELKDLFRFRVGDYRIIFECTENGEVQIFFILRIKHRREVYRI